MTDRPPFQPAGDATAAGRRNVELKARLASLEPARRVAQRIATDRLGRQLQTDTYFHSPQGRLKLREIEDGPAQLIWYDRPDQTEEKTSRYCLLAVADGDALKRILAAAWGVRQVVQKRREIFLYHNVRIHLDEVDGLGAFLEFEAVLPQDAPEQQGRQQVRQLREAFGVAASDLIAISYGDMPR